MKEGLEWVIPVCVAACLVGIAIALHAWGAVEIRTDGSAVLGLTVAGAFWIFVAFKLFAWLGLSYQYDAAEGRNSAAIIALSGAAIGVAVLYACGNFGGGPSYMENFFCAGLSTGTWLVLWLFLEMGAKISVSITEERDLASGTRLAGLLVAAGLVLGRATAGNWVSVPATMQDFVHDGWPALVLFALALPVEWLTRPSRSRPFPSWQWCGAVPACVYLAMAMMWLWHLGRWEGMT